MSSDITTKAFAPDLAIRRPELYQEACWFCATGVRPEAVFSHPVVKGWLPPYEAWKASRPAFHDPCPVADCGRMTWQALRRWVDGSVADFRVVDRLLCKLGTPTMPWTFEGQWVRRVNFPWSWEEYGMRCELVSAVSLMAEILEQHGIDASVVDGAPTAAAAHIGPYADHITHPSGCTGVVTECPACHSPVGMPVPEGETPRARRARQRAALRARRASVRTPALEAVQLAFHFGGHR